jgi:hypothetical protein
VKKRRNKSKKKQAAKKQVTHTESTPDTVALQNQPPPGAEKTPIQPPEKRKISWPRFGGKFIGWILGTPLAVLVAIYTFWGPPWPTAPTFDPGFPSFGSPLDVPFNVTNKSAIFSITDLTILCGVEDFLGTGNIRLNNVGASEAVKGQALRPLETKSYVCPLKKLILISPEPKIEKATIGFVSTYRSPWPLGGTSKSISDRFTLNATTVPPQWMRGTPLQ